MIRKLKKYQQGGSFRDQLFPQNKPIVDKTAAPILLPPNLNYDKTRVVNSSSRGLNKTQLKNINQNLRNRAEQEKKQELEEYRAAQLFHNNNPVAQFLGTRSAPVSSVKPTARELAYGLGAGINEFYDIPGIGIVNDFVNPLSVVSKGMISPWAQAPLQAQQSDSYLPYLGAAASTALTIPMVRPASIAAKTILNPRNISKGLFRGLPSFVDDVGRNLADLQEAQKFAQQYGYELPANLERISQSNMLTDRTIRGMMDRHNTFVRGVSTNWDEIAKRNPEILRHLEGKGIDWQNNPRAAAEYMATHIPINTGYGRASLNNEVFDRGLQGLYTSNSIPTAEGYTYGQGFITKVKKPTDFSSVNRQDWITKNNPHYRDEDKFRELMFPLSDETKYAIHSSKSKMWTPKSADEKLLKNATSKQKAIKEVEYRIEQLKKDISEIEPNKDKWIDAPEVIYSKKELVKQLENDIKYLEKHGDEILQAPGEFNLLRTERSNLPTDPYNFLIAKEGNAKKLSEWLKKQPYQEKMREVNDLGESLTKYSWDEQQPIRAKIKELQDEANVMYNQSIQDYMKANHPDYDPVNKYAHYIHLGTPGQKVLEPIKSWEITPELWKNKSRSHTNKYSKKFSALEYGGFIGIGGAGVLGARALQQQKKGGPIITNRGQWDYPGQTTIIPSNQITMRGVPYPVLGVDNIGHSKLMQPGRNYTFPGQYVTEYPIMQKGGTKQNPPKVYTDPIAYNKAAQSYNDSLALYKAYEFQKNNMGPGYEEWLNTVDKTYPGGKEAVRKAREKNIGKLGSSLKISTLEKGYNGSDKDYDPINSSEKKIVNYYRSLIGNSKNFRIGNHASPDLWHKYIKPIGAYYDGASSPVYKKPVQPVKYQPSQSYQLANRQSSGIKQQPLVYKPNHPIQKMNRLPMLPYLTEDSDVTINSGQFNVPAPVVQQPKGKPVYGPGNTIIGYNNNMHFTPALQYTGAPNNASNLQDKALLENPNALRQYVSRLDNYRFDKGGIYSQALRGMYSQGLNNTINGLNQFSYLSKNSSDNAMRDYYMNMSNYDSQNNNLYSTNQDLYGQNYFQDGGSYEELSNEYNDLREWQDLASMDGDNELYEYLTPDVNRLENSLKSMEDLARFDAMKEDLQRQIIQQPQYQEQPIEGYSPRRPYSNSSNTSEFLPMEFNQFQQVSSKPLKGVQQQVKSYLTQKGLSKNAIAGIMGNIEHESSFNPGIYGDQNKAFGLFQHHAQRKDNLLNFLQKRKLDKTSIEGQIDFALSEYPSLINKLNKAVSPQQAADIWVREFEKPANVEKQSKLRQRAALKYMKQGGTLPFFKQYK